MVIDFTRLTKAEIVERAKWRCQHYHNGLEHSPCFDKLKGQNVERIAFFDLETEDLKADYGIIFAWCLYDDTEKKMYEDIIKKEDLLKFTSRNRNKQPKEDTRVIKSLVDRLSNYTRVVAHYGSRFDLPFLRARSLICGIDFPAYGHLNQTDTWVILKNKFAISRRSLENSCLKLLGHTRKDHLSLSIKHGCLRGEKWALDLTLKHCRKDVLDLRDLYHKIYKFTKRSNTSI